MVINIFLIHIPLLCQIYTHTKFALRVRNEANSLLMLNNTSLTSNFLRSVRDTDHSVCRQARSHYTNKAHRLKCDLLLRYCHIHSYRHCMNNLIKYFSPIQFCVQINWINVLCYPLFAFRYKTKQFETADGLNRSLPALHFVYKFLYIYTFLYRPRYKSFNKKTSIYIIHKKTT